MKSAINTINGFIARTEEFIEKSRDTGEIEFMNSLIDDGKYIIDDIEKKDLHGVLLNLSDMFYEMIDRMAFLNRSDDRYDNGINGARTELIKLLEKINDCIVPYVLNTDNSGIPEGMELLKSIMSQNGGFNGYKGREIFGIKVA